MTYHPAVTSIIPLLCRFCKHFRGTDKDLIGRCGHPATVASNQGAFPSTAFARRKDQPCGPWARLFESAPRLPPPSPSAAT